MRGKVCKIRHFLFFFFVLYFLSLKGQRPCTGHQEAGSSDEKTYTYE